MDRNLLGDMVFEQTNFDLGRISLHDHNIYNAIVVWTLKWGDVAGASGSFLGHDP